LENDLDINVIFNGEYSHKCYGLLAVDYISWAIYRKFERRDDYFYQLFEHKINHKIEWYIKK